MAAQPKFIRALAGRLTSIRYRPADLRADLIAGLPGALTGVPGGMAAALLAGVQPILGLYASFAGPIAGGLTSRSRFIVIATTGASALAAQSALHNVRPGDRVAAIALLTLFVGLALVAGAALRVGRYTRFVSHAVMTGFLTGITVNIICGQLPVLTGVTARGPVAIAKAFYVIVHPGQINGADLLAGLGAIAIFAALARTRLSVWGALVALVIPTLAVNLFGGGSVTRVDSLGQIKPGIPAPELPSFRLLAFGMISGALAIAAIIIVQGAGVVQAMAGDATASADSDQDILAQGAGNLVSSLFGGIPVGGSLTGTLLNQSSGARTRFAAIASGVWMLAILAVFSGEVGKVVLPALAATLIYLAASALRFGEMITIARTGPSSQIAVSATFVATLALPVAAAVGIGVALSLLLQLNQDAMDLRVVELIPLDDGRLAEADPPEALAGGRVTILDVYGSLLYAGSRTLEHKLPEPEDAGAPVVILRLRGRTTVSSTFITVIADYAARLDAVGGHIYLTGVEPALARQLGRTGRLAEPVRIFEAEPVIGASTYAAYLEASGWLVTGQRRAGGSQDGDRIDG